MRASATALSPVDLYKVAKHQRRLLRVILLALAGYSGLFVIDMNADREAIQVPPEHRDRIGAESTEAKIYTFPQFVAAVCIAGMFVILAAAWLIVVVSLLSALKANIFMRLLAVIGSLVPIVSVIVLLVVSSWASGTLTRAGHKVGLLGVSSKTLAKLRADAALA